MRCGLTLSDSIPRMLVVVLPHSPPRPASSMRIRRRLIAFVLAVTASLLAGMAATPAMICQMIGEPPAVAAATVCTCAHGTDGQCPMHKHHGPGPSSSSAPISGNRWCAGCADSAEMIITAMIGFAAPIIDRSDIARPDGRSAQVHAFIEHPLDTVHPPVSPPPRG
jgi:hypothetical protein